MSYGNNSNYGVQSKANGMSCKVFLLSGYEVGYKQGNQPLPIDGAVLSYFTDGDKRIAKDDSGNAVQWWLRSPRTDDKQRAYTVTERGTQYTENTNTTKAIRPAFILPTSLAVDSNGVVTINTAPTITADKSGDLGTLTEGFTCNYIVDDVDVDDIITVTLSTDGVQESSFIATKKKSEVYNLSGNDWLKVTNGTHTFMITASDDKEIVEHSITYNRDCDHLTVTLTTPFVADDKIQACSLKTEGYLPNDAVVTYEVTNNALDDNPVWEDCSVKVRAGFSYMFKNKTAQKGFAFNFRIKAQRGTSKEGGYFTQISGGFE